MPPYARTALRPVPHHSSGRSGAHTGLEVPLTTKLVTVVDHRLPNPHLTLPDHAAPSRWLTTPPCQWTTLVFGPPPSGYMHIRVFNGYPDMQRRYVRL